MFYSVVESIFNSGTTKPLIEAVVLVRLCMDCVSVDQPVDVQFVRSKTVTSRLSFSSSAVMREKLKSI